MSVSVLGKSVCALCGKAVNSDDAFLGFPNLFVGIKHPLRKFNDSLLHSHCLNAFPEGELLAIAWKRYQAKKPRAGEYRCSICGNMITDPNDLYAFGLLPEPMPDYLAIVDCGCAHIACLSKWPYLSEFTKILNSQSIKYEWSTYEKRMILEPIARLTRQ